MSEQTTEPTLISILEEMRAGFAAVGTHLTAIEARLFTVESQLENMDMRLDRLEGDINKTRSEVMYLRADFKEFRKAFDRGPAGQPTGLAHSTPSLDEKRD